MLPPGRARLATWLTAERVRVTYEYDRNRRGRSLSRLGVDGARCHDDIDLEPDKFLRKFAHPLRFALRPSVLDGDGPSLHIAQVAKSLAETLQGHPEMRPDCPIENRSGRSCRPAARAPPAAKLPPHRREA